MPSEKTYQGQILTSGYLAGLNNLITSVSVEQEVSKVDVVIRNRYALPHILIEFKDVIRNEVERRQAFAQIVLTCKKNNIYGAFYAIAYQNADKEDVFEYFSHNDYYFNNNAVNWTNETPSNPSADAVVAVNNSLAAIQTVKGVQIRQRVLDLIDDIREYEITRHNCIKIFNDWVGVIKFDNLPLTDTNTDTIINLFITDLLNSTDEYEDKVLQDESAKFYRQNHLFREKNGLLCYELLDPQAHRDFWTIYKRPPEENEFRFIIEKRNEFFHKQYRSIVGGEYTPSILTRLQLQILNEQLGEHWREEYIVFDPCCGVGNLQDVLGEDYKQYCFLSTLDAGDVSVCRAKGYASAVQFDFLKNEGQRELWKTNRQSDIPVYEMFGEKGNINFFAKMLGRKVLAIVNPPYNGKIAGSIHGDLFVDVIDKITDVVKNCTMFIYCPADQIYGSTYIELLNKKRCGILFAGLVNAHETFGLKANWGVTMSLWKFGSKKEIPPVIKLQRYDMSKDKTEMLFAAETMYDNSRRTFCQYSQELIKNNAFGEVLGEHYHVGSTFYFCDPSGKLGENNKITTGNLEHVLLQSGVLYNIHLKYFEYPRTLAKEPMKKMSPKMKGDLITLALNYITNASNKDQDAAHRKPTHFIPFTEKELGLPRGSLMVAFDKQTKEKFDFREWYKKYPRSAEAEALHQATLQVYRFYHQHFAGQTKPNDGWNFIRAALCQGTTDIRIKKVSSHYSSTQGGHSRTGAGCKWTHTVLCRKYATDIFTVYDQALVALMRRVQDELVAAGIYLFKPSCLR